MTTAIVSMNAVDSHWALVAGTAKSRMRRGIALTMIVSLRMTTKVDSVRIRMTRLTLTPAAVSGVSAAVPASVVHVMSLIGCPRVVGGARLWPAGTGFTGVDHDRRENSSQPGVAPRDEQGPRGRQEHVGSPGRAQPR